MLTSWGDSVMIITPAAIQIIPTEFAKLVTYLGDSDQRRDNNDEFNILMKKYFLSNSQGRYSSPNSREEGRYVSAKRGVTLILDEYSRSPTQYLIGIMKTYKDEIGSLVNHAVMIQPRSIERRRRSYTRRSPSHSRSSSRSSSRSKNRSRNRTKRQNKSRSRSRSPKRANNP